MNNYYKSDLDSFLENRKILSNNIINNLDDDWINSEKLNFSIEKENIKEIIKQEENLSVKFYKAMKEKLKK